VARSRRLKIPVEDKVRVALPVPAGEMSGQRPRRLARRRDGEPPHGPWPAPKVERCEPIAVKYAEAWPTWRHRMIAALMRAEGYQVSTSTVERALRRRDLLPPRGSPGRCCGARCSETHRHAGIECGRPISASSRQPAVGSGGSAQ
jgi:hypothetical protein